MEKAIVIRMGRGERKMEMERDGRDVKKIEKGVPRRVLACLSGCM